MKKPISAKIAQVAQTISVEQHRDKIDQDRQVNVLNTFNEKPFGFYKETEHVFVCFGHAGSSKETIESNFPSKKILLLNQTHGDQTVVAKIGIAQQADGHWTKNRELILGIKTADCIPVLAFHEPTKTIAAFHAGWRGVVNGITLSGLSQIAKENQFSLSEWQIWIGPHIGFQSFVVKNDVSSTLIKVGKDAGLNPLDPEWHIEIDQTFTRFNLLYLLQRQLFKLGLNKIQNFTLDTFADSRFFSFRRDQNSGGRQISFIGFKNEY